MTLPEQRKGPAGNGADSKASSDLAPILPVSAVVHVHLAAEPDMADESRDRRELYRLNTVPDGAPVVIYVGSRQWVPIDTAMWLHAAAQRLRLEIHGTLDADIPAWLDAARSGRTGAGL